MNKKVTEYIEKQKPPQKEICDKLRKIILKTFPKINEDMKMGVPWYEGMYYIVGLKDSVNLGFSVKGLKKEDIGNFKGEGRLMRHLKFKDVKDIDEKHIIKLLKLVDKKAECGSCYK
ncbi:MAG: DUF1801 domain-containing protein [Candidatus Nanoarchaeia archaeon]|nr:DUF1801 domain-containing protein [Candidatus Nanoarchaeia archaeon]MDD5740979.1 DUF1801 domain-containing protein [Candidatus Nanoarchaeia archaeon]